MYLRFKAHRYIIKETVSFSWNLGIQCPEWRYPPNRIRGTVPPEWRFKNARNTHWSISYLRSAGASLNQPMCRPGRRKKASTHGLPYTMGHTPCCRDAFREIMVCLISITGEISPELLSKKFCRMVSRAGSLILEQNHPR